jgi:NADH:ubiquinone oxidoreductase subunit C
MMAEKSVVKMPAELLQEARELLKKWTVSENIPEENRLDIVINGGEIKECVRALVAAKWGYLAAISTLDHPEYSIEEGSNERKAIPDRGEVELLYHFCNGAAITTLRVTLPYAKNKIESICDIIPSATLYEREAMELMGIEFVGTPNVDHLLLPDGWPENVYPLRKAFTGLEKKEEK